MSRIKSFFLALIVGLSVMMSMTAPASAVVVGIGDYDRVFTQVGSPPGGLSGVIHVTTFGTQPGPALVTSAFGTFTFGGNTGEIVDVFDGFNPFGVYDNKFSGVGTPFVDGLEVFATISGVIGNEILEFDNDPGGNPNRALLFTMSGSIGPTLVEFTDPNVGHVPEPGSFPLAFAGILALTWIHRRLQSVPA